MLTSRLGRIRPFSLRLGATALTATGLIVLASAGVASAHVSILEQEVEAGAFALLTFQVPHGCDESPTTEIRIQIPVETPQVTPTVNANWEVAMTMEPLDEPVEGRFGEQLTERVAEVVYTAKTPLGAEFRDVFVLSIPIPDDLAGTVLHFPTIQTCEAGETAWIEIPAEGQSEDDLESPAPAVEVVEASVDGDAPAEEATEESVPETTGA
jgi:periplasmic copper chaperone A